MVRGHRDCSALCTSCRRDCVCSVCGCCHCCQLQNAYVGHYSGYAKIYAAAEHSCSTVPDTCDVSGNVPPSFEKNFESDMYQIKVGSEANRKSFYMHKICLTSNSAYFAGLLNFESESEKHCVTLDMPVDLPKAFSLFIQHAYLGDYVIEDNPVASENVPLHAQVYVLAERLEALELQKVALKKATAICVQLSAAAKSPNANTLKSLENIGQVVRTIYDNTPNTQTGTEDTASTTPKTSPDTKNNKKSAQRKSSNTTQTVAGSSTQTASAAKKQSKDGFRILTARFCASCLNSIKDNEEFSNCPNDFLEFAQDLMKYVVQSGPLQLDSAGQLKN